MSAKNKNPNYNFLISYTPSQARVKREGKNIQQKIIAINTVKKDILKSLILVSLVLALETVVYFVLP